MTASKYGENRTRGLADSESGRIYQTQPEIPNGIHKSAPKITTARTQITVVCHAPDESSNIVFTRANPALFPHALFQTPISFQNPTGLVSMLIVIIQLPSWVKTKAKATNLQGAYT